MTSVINEKVALSVLDKYFSTLDLTGYMRHTITDKLVVYMALLSFIDKTSYFMTDEDAALYSRIMNILFNGDNCVFRMPVGCVNRITLGTMEFMGNDRNRVEVGGTTRDRLSHDNVLRIEV